MGEPQLIQANALIEFGKQILEKMGVPSEDAQKTSEILVESNLRGVDTHGIYLVNLYAKRIEKGLINAKPNFQFTRTRPAAGILDADTSLGQLATLEAMNQAIEMAKEVGVGTVMVKRSTHFGAGAYYTLHAASQGMIGILMSHSETDVVLFGGKKPYLGTNPYSVAIPAANGKPFLMDMATSEVAFGKVRAAAEAKKEIPPNWAVDAEGNPVTDATQAKAVTPMSGAKGYAIGLMIELLSSGLTGMAYGPGIVRKFDDWENPQNLGHFVQAIDPTAFTQDDSFFNRVDEIFEDIQSQPASTGNPFGKVLIPGAPEFARKEQRLAEGCPVAPEIASQLKDLGDRLGVNWPG
ncbi:MAG: Ldh family oxidoreductase [Candidatus Omnitrophica bacterium]|nr:Ldh family oxidoreductase [Candidatus Omnitrophota bacterium]